AGVDTGETRSHQKMRSQSKLADAPSSDQERRIPLPNPEETFSPARFQPVRGVDTGDDGLGGPPVPPDVLQEHLGLSGWKERHRHRGSARLSRHAEPDGPAVERALIR